MYAIGYFIGKLIFAYVFVWLVCFCIAKFRYKKATKLAHGLKGIIAIAIMFIVPFVAGLSTVYA